jgi:hypothetical protein
LKTSASKDSLNFRITKKQPEDIKDGTFQDLMFTAIETY